MMYAVLSRSLLSFLTAFAAAALLGVAAVPVLRSVYFGAGSGKAARAEKSVPSMGGIVILAAVIAASLFWGRDSYALILIALLAAGLFGLLGFADDFIGVLRRTSAGLLPWQRLIAEGILALGISILLYRAPGVGGTLWLDRLDIGPFYIPFAAAVILATVNAVHLTDGLDGLAPTVTGVYSLFMGALLCIAVVCAAPSASPDRLLSLSALSVFSTAVAGGCIGFLVQGAFPARLKPGRTGTFALGGAIAATSLLSGTALLLPLMGICFWASAISVILQAISLRADNTLLKEAPLHQHFLRSGVAAPRIVSMYGIITCVFSAAALLLYWFFK